VAKSVAPIRLRLSIRLSTIQASAAGLLYLRWRLAGTGAVIQSGLDEIIDGFDEWGLTLRPEPGLMVATLRFYRFRSRSVLRAHGACHYAKREQEEFSYHFF